MLSRMSITWTSYDGVVVLSLARGKANALDEALVAELAAAVERVATADDARALVLASALPKVFSAGFDVTEVFAYPPPRMRAFFTRFMGLFERLRRLPKPVVAALGGSAFAGGAILALACDFRVMAEGARLSVNEVELGVMLPDPMIRAMASAGPPELMRSMLLDAEVVSAERALAAGLVSEIVAPERVLDAAVSRARRLGDKPPLAFAAHKRALAGAALEPSDAEIDEVMQVWFGPEATARRRALVERLGKKA